jgi:hypothetical protein
MEKHTERTALQVLERMATALEELAKDPVIEVEAAPPTCPRCGTFNPHFWVENELGDGPLAECVLYGRCGNCSERFYAMPVTWHMHTLRELVDAELKERAEMRDGSQGGN